MLTGIHCQMILYLLHVIFLTLEVVLFVGNLAIIANSTMEPKLIALTLDSEGAS